MNIWLFRGADQLNALTIDHSGTNLPDELGPWQLVRMVTLNGGRPDEHEALALVAEHGFCCFQ